MSEKTKRYFLSEEEIPRYWYNILAEMPVKPLPPLNPATREPLKPEDLYPVFAEELCRQEPLVLEGFAAYKLKALQVADRENNYLL